MRSPATASSSGSHAGWREAHAEGRAASEGAPPPPLPARTGPMRAAASLSSSLSAPAAMPSSAHCPPTSRCYSLHTPADRPPRPLLHPVTLVAHPALRSPAPCLPLQATGVEKKKKKKKAKKEDEMSEEQRKQQEEARECCVRASRARELLCRVGCCCCCGPVSAGACWPNRLSVPYAPARPPARLPQSRRRGCQ